MEPKTLLIAAIVFIFGFVIGESVNLQVTTKPIVYQSPDKATVTLSKKIINENTYLKIKIQEYKYKLQMCKDKD